VVVEECGYFGVLGLEFGVVVKALGGRLKFLLPPGVGCEIIHVEAIEWRDGA
jgi:hypothetical protein